MAGLRARAAVSLDPKSAEFHFELSRVFGALKMAAEESSELEIALRLDQMLTAIMGAFWSSCTIKISPFFKTNFW